MLKGQDILVLLKLLRAPAGPTLRALGAELGLDPASTHRAVKRLREARLVGGPRLRPNRAAAEEFLLHGFRYAFPAREGAPTRGIATAWGAPPLRGRIQADDPPPVWPYPEGDAHGLALEPIHRKVPEATRDDPELAEQLALLDALRVGDGRVRGLATDELRRQLRATAPVA
jgi:hypothetical protein